jgi:hypothetical protein
VFDQWHVCRDLSGLQGKLKYSKFTESARLERIRFGLHDTCTYRLNTDDGSSDKTWTSAHTLRYSSRYCRPCVAVPILALMTSSNEFNGWLDS